MTMDIDLKKLFARFKKPSEKREWVVERDWRLIVISFLALNFAVIGCSLYLFWISNSADLGDNSPAPIAETFKQKSLDALMAKFDARKALFAELQTSKPTSTDPSL